MSDSEKKQTPPSPAKNEEQKEAPAGAKEAAAVKAEGKENAPAEAREAAAVKAEGKESAPAKAEGKVGTETVLLKPASKRATDTRRRTARQAGASPGAGSSRKDGAGAPQPPRHDAAKIIAIGACVVLFLACVGVAVLKWPVIAKRWNRMFGSQQEVVRKLPDNVQKMVDDFDQADVLYTEAVERGKSDKLEDLQEAQRKMGQARDAWGTVNEYDKTYEGFEEKRNHAEKMLAASSKEFRDLNKKVDELEQEARRLGHKAEEEAKTSQTPAPATAPSPGGVELIDEEAYKKMKENDPSEFERYTKLLDKGKAKFKPKGGETPAPDAKAQETPANQPKAPETPAKAEEKPAPEAPAKTPEKEVPPPAPKDDANKVPEKAPDKPAE